MDVARSQAHTGDILIVDDDAEIRDLLSGFLSEEGYQTRQAANGSEAMMAIAQQPPALMILDLLMPVLSGEDVLAQLDRAGQHISCVLTTAMPAVAQPLIKRYGLKCITKPFALDDILDCVEQCVQREKTR